MEVEVGVAVKRLKGNGTMSNSQPRKPTKLERERAMYEKLGKKHPDDVAIEFALRYFRKMAAKQGSTTPRPDAGSDSEQ